MTDNTICDYCNNEIDGFHGFHTGLTRFCSDKCRVDYHNTLRKIDRKTASIQRMLNELLEMHKMAESHHMADRVRAALVTSKCEAWDALDGIENKS